MGGNNDCIYTLVCTMKEGVAYSIHYANGSINIIIGLLKVQVIKTFSMRNLVAYRIGRQYWCKKEGNKTRV